MTRTLLSTSISDGLLQGALEVEQTARGLLPHRLPAWARIRNTDAQLAMVEAQPAGVRLAFRTPATTIELDAVPTRYALRPVGTVRFAGLPDRPKNVEIWLPHQERTELVALRTDMPVAPLTDRRPVWLHHGSSISQGSNATSPTTTWPAIAAQLGDVRLVNLGFGGGALLDPFTARTLRDTSADLISLKIGINLVNTDVMRLRAFTPAVHGFLDTVRDGHPTTPLLVVSPIHCPVHEDTPGPGSFDLAALRTGQLRFRATGDPAERAAGKLTVRVIRDELSRIVAQRADADPNLHHLDGLDLYGEDDSTERPLPDELHPDTDTHRLIGERFARHAFSVEGPFGHPKT